jgi:hypothetical protein
MLRRRRLIPGALAVSGTDVWVADVSQPALVRRRSDGSIEQTWLAGDDGHGPVRRLHADESGVWLVDDGGVRHCDQDGHVREVVREQVGDSALAGGLLATVPPGEWPVPPTPVRVGLHSLTAATRWVELPCEVLTLGSAGRDFVALGLDYGPRPDTAQDERVPRLVRVGHSGMVETGPPLADNDIVLGDPAIIGAEHLSLLDRDRLRPIRNDLSLECGVATGTAWNAWDVGVDRVIVCCRYPDGTTGQGRELLSQWRLPPPPNDPLADWAALVLFRASDLTPLASAPVAGIPDHVGYDSDGTIWISLPKQTYHGLEHRMVEYWRPAQRDVIEELPLGRLLENSLTFPVSQPLPDDQLDTWMQRQVTAAAHQVGAPTDNTTEEPGQVATYGFGSYGVTSVELRGGWPEAHVVIHFRTHGTPTRDGGYAIPLFNHDGGLEPIDTDDYLDIAIMEDIDTGLFDLLAQQTPAPGTVWLRPPAEPEVHIPQLE